MGSEAEHGSDGMYLKFFKNTITPNGFVFIGSCGYFHAHEDVPYLTSIWGEFD